jgi:Glycosyl hydrolase family 26
MRFGSRLVAAGVCAAVVASAAAGAPGAPGSIRVTRTQLGVAGDAQRFARITGQETTLRHSFIGWHQARSISKVIANHAPVPMLAVKTGGIVTPLDIAMGRGDTFLLELNRAVSEFGQRVYVRPMPEMNGAWNEYCAFNRDGSSRGPRFSTAAFRKAFARIALIAHGGSANRINTRLRRLGLPQITGDLPETEVRIVWNPQGYGNPDIPANSAKAYYPGDAYVDVVANDLYDQRFNAAWDANAKLYAAHPNKPFAIAEWGLWGIDDPAFVERMAAFVKGHGRIEFLSYFNGDAGAPWDLASKPRSRAAYRRLITPLGG